MSSHELSSGWRQQVVSRVGAALLLALLTAIFTRTSHAAPLGQPIEPCNQPGLATIIDPEGGAIQVRMYNDATPYNVVNYPTSVQRIELAGGQVVYGFCIDSNQERATGVTVCLLSEISNVRLAYLIAKYPPDTLDNINQAARQAAVWHFSNGFMLDLSDPTTLGPDIDAEVASRYTSLVDEINAINPSNPPAILASGLLAMSVDPVTGINQLPMEPDHAIIVTLTKGSLPLTNIQVQVASDFGLFDQTTVVTDAKGEAKFTLRSSVVGTANITATAVVTLPRSLEYVVRDSPTDMQPFGIPSSITETVTATATKEWRTTPPPLGRITLTKSVQGTAVGDHWDFSFTLSANGALVSTGSVSNTSPSLTWDDLIPNLTYTLSEIPPGGAWDAGDFSCSGGPDADLVTPGFQIYVEPGAQVSCSITNTKLSPGQITVTKTVSGTEEAWSFRFLLDGGNEQPVLTGSPKAVWSNLTPNRTYSISEENPGSEWKPGELACFVDAARVYDLDESTPDFQVEVKPGANVTCAIENTKITPLPEMGRIILTKRMPHVPVTESWQVTFTLSYGLESVTRIASNGAPTVRWENLQPSRRYTLTEINPDSGEDVGALACNMGGESKNDADANSPGFQIDVTSGATIECSSDTVGTFLFLPVVKHTAAQ